MRFPDAQLVDGGAVDEGALLGDLRWLGLVWDEGPDVGGPFGPYRRSERAAIYRDHLDRLIENGGAYERDGALWFRVPPGATVVHDLIKGDVAFDHAAISDFVVRKADGAPSSNLATAVDDATMRIDLVLRDDEHFESTARQILLARGLGYQPPHYAHTAPVLVGEPGPADADDIGALRRAGYLPEAVIEHLALLGWSAPDAREAFTLDELAPLFSLDRVGHAPSHHDRARLRAFNGRALRALPRDRYHALVAEWMQRYGLLEDPVPDAAGRWIETFLDAYGGELHTLREAVDEIAKLREEAVTLPAL
ncbi:MAG: glutamate--tRNA ligase [Candidatus Eremiobacteraeota bacterium]|nr:glutamate--tRNA ligase [Candidatus Eremiobacteraeota bacterium]